MLFWNGLTDISVGTVSYNRLFLVLEAHRLEGRMPLQLHLRVNSGM